MNLEIVVVIITTLICIETTYLTIMKFKQRKLKVSRGSLLLDTSALMDGRIVDVAKSGVITAELIIPRSVIGEMQLLADKSDHAKRARARAGLENVRVLQKMNSVTTTIVNDGELDKGGVDRRLLDIALKYDASICTTDFNLNKVAKVSDITVVNVNELAQIMRVQLLPGDRVEIKIIQDGQNRDQGVGYLDDGTMVVVDRGRKNMGSKVNVEITRSLQTEAGRMMFAKKIR
jgi:Integral membrane protein (PIN domain superfamily)